MPVKKLKSNNGATILIALVFFLLCAAAGSVLLASGTTSSGRMAGLVYQEQAYYSVSSAARSGIYFSRSCPYLIISRTIVELMC